MVGVGWSGGGKIETSVLEQQLNKKKRIVGFILLSLFRIHFRIGEFISL